ncbi:MAG: hypothetical protein IT488_03545 [Gammaproteobacteria bacterium]|nr:hypothetical protein [Gammaproteobacteria bacterium]
MRSAESLPPVHSQRGAATLVITLLLLFSMSLMMLYAARVGVVEQRLAANDTQARAAFAAAQAGLERTLGELATLDPESLGYDAAGWTALDIEDGILSNGAEYHTEVNNQALVPFDAGLLRLESRGSTGTGGGARSATLLAAFASLLPNVPPAPLVTRGNLSHADTLTLANLARPVGAWIGGLYTPGGILDPQFAAPASCPPFGICAGDARIGALAPEAFFANTFGRPPPAVRSAALIAQCTPCDPAAITAEARLIWYENDGAAVTIAAGQLGTEAHPVIAIVAGDFAPAGALHIHGLLFVLGDWVAGGAPLSVEGAVIVAGDITGIGPTGLVYDADALEALHLDGRYAFVPGSWTDL